MQACDVHARVRVLVGASSTPLRWEAREKSVSKLVRIDSSASATRPDCSGNFTGLVVHMRQVERALRVLDGAILVLCSVGGVQSQSITVDRQMRRYHVPRMAFINKCDRVGADPKKVMKQLRDKLRLNSCAVQVYTSLCPEAHVCTWAAIVRSLDRSVREGAGEGRPPGRSVLHPHKRRLQHAHFTFACTVLGPARALRTAPSGA
jgi:hypothetical protein